MSALDTRMFGHCVYRSHTLVADEDIGLSGVDSYDRLSSTPRDLAVMRIAPVERNVDRLSAWMLLSGSVMHVSGLT